MSVIISKGRFPVGFSIAIILFATGFFFLTRHFFHIIIFSEYLQIDRLIAAVIFTGLFGYMLFKCLQECKGINVYEQSIKIKWAFGLVSLIIPKEGITQYGESTRKETKLLYLRKGKADIWLEEGFTDNYYELIEQLRAWRIKRKDNILINEFSKLEKKIGNVVMVLLGVLICTAIFYHSYLKAGKTIENSSLIEISGELSGLPNIDRPTLKSPSQGVSLHLREYPSITFKVGAPGYDAMNLSELEEYRTGSPITVWIEKEEYLKKIAQTARPNFTDKHFGWEYISVYQVQRSGHKVLELDKFNSEVQATNDSNRKWGWVIMAVVGFVFFGGMKIFR